eukprot:jgi/Chlat1/1527/Chrsp122S01818
MDEVAKGVVETEEGVQRVYVTDIDELEGAHFACLLDPKKHPEFQDQILGIANVDVYVGTHGGHGALSLFLPRCAAFLEVRALSGGVCRLCEYISGLCCLLYWAVAFAVDANTVTAYVQIDSECGHGHWSPASTYSSAIGFLADWQRSNDTLVKVSLVPKDYSLKFGLPQGSNVSTSCAGLRGSMGYVGYNYSPDFEGWVKGVVDEGMDEGRQEWMRSYCNEEGIASVQLST